MIRKICHSLAFLPLLLDGGCGVIHPFSNPLSIMAHSMFLMVTGGSLMPSTQDPSQGAGQTRPVNSGKLLVLNKNYKIFLK